MQTNEGIESILGKQAFVVVSIRLLPVVTDYGQA